MIGKVEELSNGVVVCQATDESAPKCNIYCEFPWCPPDSHCFVYSRHKPEAAPNSWEYVACDFGTWKKRVIGCGGGCGMSGGRFYYTRKTAKGRRELVRVDLMREATEAREIPPGMPHDSACISPDERYLAYSYALSFKPQRFGIGLADLETGKCEIIHEDPYVCNTHLQFERAEGRQLLVQHNRGCVFSPEGKCEILCGKEGCTLFLLDVPDGKVTRLQVGPPFTASCSGHETWLGETKDVIFTLNIQEDYDYGKGPIGIVGAGRPHRIVCPPWEMNHVGVPLSGRILCADTCSPDAVIIGSPKTNRVAMVCQAKTSYKRATPDAHPHAYISPDLKWVVFNSDRTGVQQVYAAAIPPETIAELERAN